MNILKFVVLLLCGNMICLYGQSSYLECMEQAEYLLKKRYEPNSRVYKIMEQKLDAVFASKETESKKIEALKRLIAEMQKGIPLEKKETPEKRTVVLPRKDGKSEYAQAMQCLKKDPVNAEVLLKQSLAYGYGDAAAALGDLYAAKEQTDIIYRPLAEKYYEIALKNKITRVERPLSKLYAKHYKQLDAERKKQTIAWLEEYSKSDPSALIELADVYMYDNPQLALQYIRRAEKQKNPEAYYRLGMIYYNGILVKRSYAESFRYFEKGSRRGHRNSKIMLAGNYLEGKGTISNPKQAYLLYKELFDSGMKSAGIPLGYLCFHGSGVKKNYLRALNYLNIGQSAKPVLAGNFQPWSIQGIIYYYGTYGVIADPKKARITLEKAVSMKEDNPEAWYILGCLQESDTKAFPYFKTSAELGYMKAKGMLGRMYYFGRGVKKDYVLALQYLIPAAKTGDLEAGRLVADYYFEKKVNLPDAYDFYLKQAENGDAYCLYKCGVMALDGTGTEKDTKRAYIFFTKSAEKEYTEAIYLCGRIEYEKKEWKKAYKNFRKAADKGHKEAMHLFAVMCMDGNGVKADPVTGLRYLQKLADLGNSTAQEKVGEYYENGIGNVVKRDLIQAELYYDMAMRQGSIKARIRLAYMAYEAKNYSRAAELIRNPAEKGIPAAAYLLGIMYLEGNGVPQDHEKALIYLSQAADKKYQAALEIVGPMLYYHKKYEKALKYLKDSSKANTPEYSYMIGHICYLGISGKSDYSKALEALTLAADSGHINAMLLIGKMYHQGEGVEQNYTRALSWYRKAADKDSPEGMLSVGLMYYNGNGVSPNFPEALKWFKKAGEKGNIVAIRYIEIIYRKGQGVPVNEKEAAKWTQKRQKLMK